MENATLVCRILLDRDYLAIKKELQTLKKDVARRLYYHKIDILLRNMNKKVVKCTCKQCLHIKYHNYPEDYHRVIISLQSDDHSNDDSNENVHLSTIILSSYDGYDNNNETETQTENVKDKDNETDSCRLEKYFTSLCKHHHLPIPKFDSNTEANLWKRLGHRQGKNEPNIDDDCWRNMIIQMPYSEQVKKLYKGIMHDMIVILDQLDHRPLSFIRIKQPSFEDWFKFKKTNLDSS